MKYHIERNTVQETLVIPLYGRKKCSELYKNLYYDENAIKLVDSLDYDFSLLEEKSKKLMYRFGFLEAAIRQYDIIQEVKDYLNKNPKAAVVNLGCGLDDIKSHVDNNMCKFYNLDYKDVIELRNVLIEKNEREENIACDLNDTSWFSKIDKSNGVVFFAAGVFYYFLKENVIELINKMASYFKNGKLVFDAANKKAVKLMLKTWIKTASIKDVNAYFAITDAKKELLPTNSSFVVSSKGYMLGYNDLKDKSVSKFFRFLSKIGDNMMKMQIVRIDFNEK